MIGIFSVKFGRHVTLNFEAKDFAELAWLLGRIKGKFLLSLNDCAEVRVAFGRFRIDPVMTKYSTANRRELLIRNY